MKTSNYIKIKPLCGTKGESTLSDISTAVALLIEGFMQDGFSSLKNQALVDEMRTRLTVHLECELKR